MVPTLRRRCGSCLVEKDESHPREREVSPFIVRQAAKAPPDVVVCTDRYWKPGRYGAGTSMEVNGP